VKYVALVDDSNSRGAMDMGLLPESGPGYAKVAQGLSGPEMIADAGLGALWVVGADPLAGRKLAGAKTFLVVQDLFLTETAAQADVVLPSASAYEKSGTVTNGCGELQRLKAGAKVMGVKSDLEIFGLVGKQLGLDVGIWTPDAVFEEIRTKVPGYGVPLALVATGGAAATQPAGAAATTAPELIRSAEETVFTSGTLGRHSKMLTSVMEAPGRLYGK